MNRRKPPFFINNINKKYFLLFFLFNLVFFSSLFFTEENVYQNNTDLTIKSQNYLDDQTILPNIVDMQTFHQYDEVIITYNILFCNNSNFILKINNSLVNFGTILNNGFNLSHNINSSQVGIFKLDLYIYNQTNPISSENLIISNSLSIQIIHAVEKNIYAPILIGLGSIFVIGLLFFGFGPSSDNLSKKLIQKSMKDPVLSKKYSNLINSEVIFSNTELSSILHNIKKTPSNIDLDIETLDNEEFLANFRGIDLK